MNSEKRKRLSFDGWCFGDVADFLGLSKTDLARVVMLADLSDTNKHKVAQ